jgi:hypothetical protein
MLEHFNFFTNTRFIRPVSVATLKFELYFWIYATTDHRWVSWLTDKLVTKRHQIKALLMYTNEGRVYLEHHKIINKYIFSLGSDQQMCRSSRIYWHFQLLPHHVSEIHCHHRGPYYLRSYSSNICVTDVCGSQFVQCGQLSRDVTISRQMAALDKL